MDMPSVCTIVTRLYPLHPSCARGILSGRSKQMSDQAHFNGTPTKPSRNSEPPLLLLRAESLRHIGSQEVIAGLPESLRARDISSVELDFTDLVVAGVFRDPSEAVRRLTGSQSAFLTALAQKADAEIVFCGLAHIPLVVLAGHLVTDRQKVYLMDYHPSPGSETWTWPAEPGAFPELVAQGFPKKGRATAGAAVVRMSISYLATAAQTAKVVTNPVLSLDLSVPEPVRDIVKSEAQVRAYGRVFRQTLDRIARDFPEVQRVHLCYAGPVSLAFHIGQQISQNIHPPVTAWNYHRAYDWGIDLEAAILTDEAVVRPASG